MKSKDSIDILNVYECLNLKNRKIYTYDLSWKNHCEDAEFYYSSFSEAVSDASIEALEEAEVYDNDITIWIYELDSSKPSLKPLKAFTISAYV